MKSAFIIHQHLPEQTSPDELDVLLQAEAIGNSLREIGFTSELIPVSLNLQNLHDRLTSCRPDLVFNLVETLNGGGRLIHLVAALLDLLGIPYTGSGQFALQVTTGKAMSKELMYKRDLPTPGYFLQDGLKNLIRGRRYILKPVWEDASVGINDDNVVTHENAGFVLDRKLKSGLREWFFEEYVEGREFNVSLLESVNGWKVFTPAEIVYRDYPRGKPKILGYESKWQEESFEYRNTLRTFDFAGSDLPLLGELRDLSRKTLEVFNLGGYARIDFRVDEQNRPWILEVNANPCLSPDAGFFAACQNQGISYTEMVRHICQTALINKSIQP